MTIELPGGSELTCFTSHTIITPGAFRRTGQLLLTMLIHMWFIKNAWWTLRPENQLNLRDLRLTQRNETWLPLRLQKFSRSAQSWMSASDEMALYDRGRKKRRKSLPCFVSTFVLKLKDVKGMDIWELLWLEWERIKPAINLVFSPHSVGTVGWGVLAESVSLALCT